jgi:hypothetical protein
VGLPASGGLDQKTFLRSFLVYWQSTFAKYPKEGHDMKIPYILLALALCFAAAGCAPLGRSISDVDYDYNVTTDFKRIKTYDWHPTSGTTKMNQLTTARVKQAVENQLNAKGIENSSESPDFLIIVYGGISREYTTRWRGWDDELWYEEGRLKLAFFDPASNQVFWWAETRADVFYNMEPDERNKVVNDAVTRILTKFPPN